jgi:hypothetical protein
VFGGAFGVLRITGALVHVLSIGWCLKQEGLFEVNKI